MLVWFDCLKELLSTLDGNKNKGIKNLAPDRDCRLPCAYGTTHTNNQSIPPPTSPLALAQHCIRTTLASPRGVHTISIYKYFMGVRH